MWFRLFFWLANVTLHLRGYIITCCFGIYFSSHGSLHMLLDVDEIIFKKRLVGTEIFFLTRGRKKRFWGLFCFLNTHICVDKALMTVSLSLWKGWPHSCAMCFGRGSQGFCITSKPAGLPSVLHCGGISHRPQHHPQKTGEPLLQVEQQASPPLQIIHKFQTFIKPDKQSWNASSFSFASGESLR